jgi:hypothetical protein
MKIELLNMFEISEIESACTKFCHLHASCNLTLNYREIRSFYYILYISDK